ncbi:hypothetical protein [Halalkalirubrum salinum]|uniref:hypothetical protein n=1 Tax=Halalkalirubrum salinum TaxID=2563889 RepID=UPI0010FB3C75|nr:hypothetical protein [Halalkalirubrum salinum]
MVAPNPGSSNHDERSHIRPGHATDQSSVCVPSIDAVTDLQPADPSVYRSTQTDVRADRGFDDESTEDPEPLSSAEYVARVYDLVFTDVAAAGDRIGDLLVLLESGSLDRSVHRRASDTIEWIGIRCPRELVVWSEGFRTVARSDDPELAFVGLRSLAQMATVNEQAATKGIDPALSRLDSPSSNLRVSALSLLAEVGSRDTERVSQGDRSIARSATASEPRVRTAAAIAAGNLLGEDPQRFPRTSMRLFDLLEDSHEVVNTYGHIALVHFAVEHPDVVPEKAAAIDYLESVSDDELGLQPGSVAEAVAAVAKTGFCR